MRIVVACVCVDGWLLRLWGRLARLGLLAWSWLVQPRPWEQQLGRFRRLAVAALRQVNQLIGMGAVAMGKPGGAHVDDPWTMEYDRGEHRQVRGHGESDGTVTAESGSRGLEAGEHVTP